MVSARNGAEAVLLVEAQARGIGLVITDAIVPDIGTDALARQVRGQCPPVCLLYMMSGYPQAGDPILAAPAPGGGPVNPALLSG